MSWGLTTVRAILMNAKYTGRQVWNRQPAYYMPAHLPGPFRTQRWARADQWMVSRSVVHPPLVSEQDFVAVQAVRAHPVTAGCMCLWVCRAAGGAAASSRASGLARLLRQQGLIVICSEADCALEPQVPA
jgi:hypothetical protein